MDRLDWIIQVILSGVWGIWIFLLRSWKLDGVSNLIAIILGEILTGIVAGFLSLQNSKRIAIIGGLPLLIAASAYTCYLSTMGMFGPGDERYCFGALIFAPFGMASCALGVRLRMRTGSK